MQWQGSPPPSGRHDPLRTVLEAVQRKADPYLTQYGSRWGYGSQLNSIFRGGTEMVPGVGDLVALEDLQNATREGDAIGMGLGLLSAIPGIPAIGRGVGRGVRSAVNAVDSVPIRSADAPSYRVESSQDLAPTDTPESLRAQGYEIDPATNTWARTVAEEPTPESYPIRAYHGSPHSFDKFSLDAIGTGEGAQAYGHGLYFAESEDVARAYRDNVKDMGAVGRINARLSEIASELRPLEISYGKYREPRGYELKAEYDALMEQRAAGLQAPGSMYEVGINAQPDTFIDWDAPFEAQPPRVQAALTEAGFSAPSDRLAPHYRTIGYTAGPDLKKPSEAAALAQLGVSGIRYNDGFSRGPSEIYNVGAPTDDFGPYTPYTSMDEANAQLDLLRRMGFDNAEVKTQTQPQTSNYVVFSDELIKVLRKYGISGLGIGTGTAIGAGAMQDDGGI